jgi:ATP-dependent DNA helicase RecG
LFEELFEFGLALSTAAAARAVPAPAMENTDVAPLLGALPYELTGAQKRSIAEIAADLASGRRMNRILTGDVGSGKTVVAAAAAWIAVHNGYQAAIMAPTEILAAQHYESLLPLLGAHGIGVLLLTGSAAAAQKRKVHEAIAGGIGADVVIGTHALLSESVSFSRLGLVIEDEQHRFGVMQRAALAEKSGDAHLLVMSATPIPRTLSLLAYGGLSISRLDEMPPGRQAVDTYVVGEAYRERLNAFILRQTEAGHQVYVVCPAVEEEKKDASSDDPEELTDPMFSDAQEDRPPLKAAVEHAAALAAAFPSLRVGFFHGKLQPA